MKTNLPQNERYGLIGDPISTSRSPLLFGAAYQGQKPYDLIEGSCFETSWETFLKDYKAINVTAPFKEKAFEKVASLAIRPSGGWGGELSGPCFKIRATNLVVKTLDENGQPVLQAHNSDFTGIILSVAEAYFPGLVKTALAQFGPRAHIKIHQFVRENIGELFSLRPQALIVGCGGAGKAAAVAAAEMGFAVALMNRSPEKAQKLSAALPEYSFLPVPVTDLREAVRECDLVIYTVPGPMDGIEELSPEVLSCAGEGRRPKVILEANYKTPVLGPGPGWTYVSGKEWHLYQALTGYGLMTGVQPGLEAMEREVR